MEVILIVVALTIVEMAILTWCSGKGASMGVAGPLAREPEVLLKKERKSIFKSPLNLMMVSDIVSYLVFKPVWKWSVKGQYYYLQWMNTPTLCCVLKEESSTVQFNSLSGTIEVEALIHDVEEGWDDSIPVQEENKEGEEHKVKLEDVYREHLNKTSLAAIKASKMHDDGGDIPQHAAARENDKQMQDRLRHVFVKRHHPAPYLQIVEENWYEHDHIEGKNCTSNTYHLKDNGHKILLATNEEGEAEWTMDPAAPVDLSLGNHQPDRSYDESKDHNDTQANGHQPEVDTADVTLEADVEGDGAEGKHTVMAQA